MSFDSWFSARRDVVADSVRAFIDLNTVTPFEALAEPFLREHFASVGFDVSQAGDWQSARAHEDWSPHPASSTASVSWIAESRSPSDLPTVIVNAHIDVVPQLPGQEHGSPPGDSDWISGRGACDTKGNLIMVTTAMRYLQEHGIDQRFALRFHLPSEEEIGGNGTLALALGERNQAQPALAAICLEPTSLVTYVGHRGCLTYRAVFAGRAVHMGAQETGVDPIEGAARLILELREFETELVREASGSAYFDWTERPCQVNVGKISGGEWSGSVAERCELVGDVGVLPWLSIAEMEARLEGLAQRESLRGQDVSWRFDGGLRNEPYVSADLSVLEELVRSSESHGERRVWNVSCDGRHYHRVLDVPTAIFGAGSLARAHSRDEGISLDEIGRGASIVADWLAGSPST